MRPLLVLLALLLGACSSVPPHAPSAAAPAREGERARRAVPALERCDAPTDCEVVPETCCGRCGAAVPGDARAVNAAELRARAGRGEATCPGDRGCPDCFEATARTLVATCRAHRCVVVDLENHATTACRSDGDCELTFAGCCACGSPGPIALARGHESDYRRLLCGTEPMPCPECIGRPVSGAAACVAGHCAISPP